MSTFTIDADITSRRTPGFPPAPTNRNRFPARRNWPSSLRDGPRPAWWIPGIASRALHRSTK
jgi:hypothetical protein